MPDQEVAISDRKSITVTVAERYGMEADAFEIALRNTVFLEGSRAEYAAFLVVCNEYHLNPLTKEIYAFKNKQTGKIVPVVSIDGWVTLCNGHQAFDGLTFEDHHDGDGKLYATTCRIYRKDRSRPTEITEYLSECIRDTAPWKMQHRMLRHKSLIQCARYAFGFSGIYDQDEAERVEVTVVGEGDAPLLTTGFGGDKPTRTPRKPRSGSSATDVADKGSEAAPDASGGAETQDAEFTDATECEHQWHDTDEEHVKVCAACGVLREDELPTETAGVQAAEPEPATSETATPASGDGPAETSGPSAPAENERGTRRTQAPPDTLYTLYGENPGDDGVHDGRIRTWKDGVQFSRVKMDAKTKPPEYDEHAPTRPAQVSEFEEDAGPAEKDADPLAEAVAKIREAPHYLAAKQVHKSLSGAEAWQVATLEQKAAIRRSLWSRYDELAEQGVENGQVWADFTLMRLWLEFGAKAEPEIDPVWAKFWRSQAYVAAGDADKAAMTKLMQARKAELKET